MMPGVNLSESHEVTWGGLCEQFQRVARMLREDAVRHEAQDDPSVGDLAGPIQQQALEDLALMARLAAEDRRTLWRAVHLGGAEIAERCAAASWWPWTRAHWRRNAAAWRALAEAGPPPPQRQHYRPGKAV